MIHRLLVLKLIGVAGTLVGLGLTVRALAEAPISLGSASAAPSAPMLSALQPPADADSLARAIVARDPFRMGRAPSGVPFNPDAVAGATASPPPRAPRPALALAGIVLGGEPQALIDGLPGVEGSRVMRVGERVGDYVLRAIAADRVVIAGPDTMWTLRVRSQFP